MDGIFNINKTTGITSHDIVAKVRKLLKQKRVGHAGTLDPAASGVLPICVGQATRVAEYLSESGKAYQAELIFGIVTDTYDREGEIIRTASTADLTLARIQQIIPHFLGAQMQQPPRYSAIKLQGQPAYKRVRAGEDVQLEPRPIEIYQLEIIDWTPPKLTLAIECSKGTYIRSLAYDLGEHLDCGAHLGALIRTRSGPFRLTESITLDQLAEELAHSTASTHLFPADMVLEQYPAFYLDEATAERVCHGNTFLWPLEDTKTAHQELPSLARVYDAQGKFLAIADWNEEQQSWQPKKVFTSEHTV